MGTLLLFGAGFAGSHFAARCAGRGWDVVATSRDGRAGTVRFDDADSVHAALLGATHILSTVPPSTGPPNEAGGDPVLSAFGEAVALAPARWVGYLSSTGVYGDCGGAWVDESAPVRGRRAARNAADLAWQRLRGDVRVFRLPGIYGPGRSAIDRLHEGKAHRVDLPHQIFSRIHVDDIAGALFASMAAGGAGVFNIADDVPASQNDVVAHAAAIAGLPLPPMIAADDPALSAMARGFYAENRRVANGRAKRLLGWIPRYPDYRAGLAACLAAGKAVQAAPGMRS